MTDRPSRARRAARATSTPAEVTVTPLESPGGQIRQLFAGDQLEPVLEEVERLVGADADIVRVERSIVGGIAGFFGREHFEVEVVVAAPPEVPVADAGPASGAAFAEALKAALAECAHEPSSPSPDRLGADVRPAYTVVADPPPEVRPAVFERLEPPSEPRAAPMPGSSAMLVLRASETSLDELARSVEALAPSAPSIPRTGVLAVVGDGTEVVSAAEAAAVRSGGDAGDVVVMAPAPVSGRPSWMCLSSPEQAAARREVWRTDDRLVVVAVVVAPGEPAQQWARDALDALRPDQTRLAVPGWRRPDEVAGRLAVMAPVHAIELVDVVDPAAAVGYLELTVPVASIDGAVATPQRWARLLVDAAHRCVPAVESSSPHPAEVSS